MSERKTDRDPRRGTALAALAASVLWLFACTAPGGQVTPVSDVQATSVAGGVLVEWSGGEGATNFVVYRSSADTETEELATVPGDRRSYADYAVQPDGAYRYAVAAVGPGTPPEPVWQSSEEPVGPSEGVMLTVLLDGAGMVVVEGAAAPVSCAQDCVVGFEPGAQAVLTGVGEGLSFAGFSSPCPPTATCALDMDEDHEVSALFRSHVLRLTLEGGAATRATASPTDDRGVDQCVIEPGNDCLLGYTYTGGPTLKVSLNVTVTEPGGTFVGFGGACDEPQGSFCVVDLAGASEVVVRAAVPPTANPDQYLAPQGGTLSVEAPGVLGNDDASGDVSAQLVNFEGPGKVSLQPDGSFTFQTAGNSLNGASFTYRVVGEFDLVSEPTTVTIDVAPKPVAVADSYSVDEDQTLVVNAPGVLANDQNAAGASVDLVSGPGTGELDLESNGSFSYSPPQDFNGQVQFTYRVLGDLGMTSEPATVTVNVLPVNDPPSFRLVETDISATAGQPYRREGFAVEISPGGPDEQAQLVSFEVTRLPGGGNLEFFLFSSPAISRSGTLTFTASGSGTATFQVVLSEPGGMTSAPATFTITVPSSGGGGGPDGPGGGPGPGGPNPDDDDEDEDDDLTTP